MATILTNQNTVGFYKAPISKGILGCMLITSCALHVPLFSHLRDIFVYNVNGIFKHKLVWRLITAKLALLDMKDLVCGCLLMYYFRIFERRYGSRKFASYLLANFVVTTVLELGICHFLKSLDVSVNQLPSGPFCIIFPLFINYMVDIPRITRTYLLGIPVTGKTLTYLLGLQVISTSRGSLICTFSGLIAGLLCRFNIFRICDFIKFPAAICTLTEKLFGWILESNPPESDHLIGATVEIQRQQQMELLEQQMMLSRARELRERERGQRRTVGDTFFASDGVNVQEPVPGTSSGITANSYEETQEEKVQTLVEMGFERHKVVHALQRSNNDFNLATTLLLNES